MKPLVAVFVVVLVLALASTGFCQWNSIGLLGPSTSARWVGAGGLGTAAATDEGAIDFNPANLATLRLGPGTEGNDLVWRGSFTWGGGSFEDSSLKLATVNPDAGWGAAASFEHVTWSCGCEDNYAQVGYGWKLKKYPISLGVSLSNFDEHNMINLGALYEVNQKKLPPVRLGAVCANANNVDDEPAWLNLGVAVPVSERFFFALDAFDVTSSLWEAFYAFGAEYQFPNNLAVRAGSWNGGFTGGLGVKLNQWSLDVAFNQWGDDWYGDDENQWTVTGGVNF